MCCRVILEFIIRCHLAIYQGCIEFWQKGCIIGSLYLVRPNYHTCERRLWFGIFLVCSSVGFTLMLYYLDIYSQNVFRIVIEDHSRYEEFNYPTLGICEMGVENDQETLAKLENILTGTVYKKFSSLNSSNELKNFVHMMSFQNLNKDVLIKKFINYTETLAPNVKKYLQTFDYKKFVNNITSNCEEFFDQCTWLNEYKFNCCDIFRVVPTMLGKCFLFNSRQTSNQKAIKLVKQIEIFREPYCLNLTFTKAAKLFLLNGNDIPETIAPLPRYLLDERGVTLSLEFNVVPTINDRSLLYLEPQILRCIPSHSNFMDKERTYPFQSYTTCITEKYYKDQITRCNCTDFYAPESKVRVVLKNLNTNNTKMYLKQAKNGITLKILILSTTVLMYGLLSMLCNLTQLLCLENDTRSSNTALVGQCLPNCDDAEYHVENVYYSENMGVNSTKVFTLDFVLLNFPTTHRRRQAIRQGEDKLAAFSGIMGLFLGLSVVSVLEFLYLTCCAFWKYKQTSVTKIAATIRAKPKEAVRKTAAKTQIVFQP